MSGQVGVGRGGEGWGGGGEGVGREWDRSMTERACTHIAQVWLTIKEIRVVGTLSEVH